MGMSVFNRPQAGACPVCGAPMYYRQAPILLEHDFEQYDVWANVRYCEDCGIEIMVPGEAKIARHSARYAVEKDIRAKEAAARNAAQAKPRKEHPFLPKEAAVTVQAKSAQVKQAVGEQKEQAIPEAVRQKDPSQDREKKASVTQAPAGNAKPTDTKPQGSPKGPAGHPESVNRRQDPQNQKNRGDQKKQPEQAGRKDPARQNQPKPNQSKQNQPKQNTGGIPQALKDRLPIGKTRPGELPITKGRFGMSDLNLTSSAAQNISNLLDMTETREIIQENGLEAASSLTAQNVDEYLLAEELSVAPQTDRRDKRKNRGQDGRRPERADIPKAGGQPSADARKDQGAKSQPPIKNNADGKPAGKQSANIQNPDVKIEKGVGEKRPDPERAKNAQAQGQNRQPEQKSQNGLSQGTGKDPRNAGPQRPQPQETNREAGSRPVQTTPPQKPADTRSQNDAAARNKAPDASQTPKQNGQLTERSATAEPKPQATGVERPALKPEPVQSATSAQKPEPAKKADGKPGQEPQDAAEKATAQEKAESEKKNDRTGADNPTTAKEQEQKKTAPDPSVKEQATAMETRAEKPEAADGKEKAVEVPELGKGAESLNAEGTNPEDKTAKTDTKKTSSQEKPQEPENVAENGEDAEELSGQETGPKPDPARFRKTIARHLPAWVVSRIPFLADAVNIPTDTPISVEKDFVKRYQAPHCQEIVGDLLYDTDTSEMFLRKESSYGFDRPCIHFNYRSQNGHFFCCSVRYDRHDKNGHVELRPMDTEMEVKPMLRRYPELYKRFFDSDLKNA